MALQLQGVCTRSWDHGRKPRPAERGAGRGWGGEREGRGVRGAPRSVPCPLDAGLERLWQGLTNERSRAVHPGLAASACRIP